MKRYEVKMAVIVEAEDERAAMMAAMDLVQETPAMKEFAASMPIEAEHLSAMGAAGVEIERTDG